jgi:hypothetical protein
MPWTLVSASFQHHHPLILSNTACDIYNVFKEATGIEPYLDFVLLPTCFNLFGALNLFTNTRYFLIYVLPFSA